MNIHKAITLIDSLSPRQLGLLRKVARYGQVKVRGHLVRSALVLERMGLVDLPTLQGSFISGRSRDWSATVRIRKGK